MHFALLPLVGWIAGPDRMTPPWLIAPEFTIAAIPYLICVGGLVGLVLLIHFLFTLPMRRTERARLFLDLVNGAIGHGQSVEQMVLSVAQSRDRTVGFHFHLLAAHIENGLRFTQAQEIVPRLFPPKISAMLAAGERLGDLKKVLPACHEILRDRPTAVRSAMNYLILVVLVFSPAFILVLCLTTVFVIPKFRDVAAALGIRLWPETMFVFGNTGLLVILEICVSIFLAMAVLIYLGGPRLFHWLKIGRIPIQDWIAWHIPWKQKRLLCAFSAMLAVLLDGGVPEAEAIRLAGVCTANEICRRRAQRVLASLERGEKLNDAVRQFDDTGEFYWRLTNATHSRAGFLDALRGWHDALNAKAFQQEETTAHLITSGVVIFNGALVALIATAMFGILVAILNGVLERT